MKFLPTNAEVCQMDKLTIVNNKKAKCVFCGSWKNDHLNFGPMYKLENVTAHYYCVLLSNRLIQNGSDNEGILGFLLSDIRQELKRTKSILCIYCNQGYANISCAKKKCKRNFHLPCGLKFGTSHQFMQQFRSFCHVHQLHQHIPTKILNEASKTEPICCICHETVCIDNKKTFLWAPCCLKTWYHRICIQKLAHSAGYFFRCAACNNVKKFNEWMQKFGIFVPQQDASWELVPHAFEELLFRYSNCDAETCKCPKGRNTNTENTMWEVVLCDSCGSQGIHVGCGNLKFADPKWECPGCQSVTINLKPTPQTNSCLKTEEGSSKLLILTEVSQKKRRRGSEDIENSVLDKRKKVKTAVEEEEIEVDVVTIDSNNDEAFAEAADTPKVIEEVVNVGSIETKTVQGKDPQEILSLLKPGPLSYKLAVIGKVLGSPSIETNKNPSEVELIELSDSDDDVEIIETTENQTAEELTVPFFHYKVKKTCMEEREDKAGETCTNNNPPETISTSQEKPIVVDSILRQLLCPVIENPEMDVEKTGNDAKE